MYASFYISAKIYINEQHWGAVKPQTLRPPTFQSDLQILGPVYSPQDCVRYTL
jgi:hypothetical protein